MNIPNPPSIIQVKRFIKASRERVFAAWTTPSQIPQWFGDSACRVFDAKIDLQVGGEYKFRILHEPDGEVVVAGKYREISAPEKLVFTWQWLDDPDWENLESVVTVELVKVDGGTEVKLTHVGFPNDESFAGHHKGWETSLTKLEALAF